MKSLKFLLRFTVAIASTLYTATVFSCLWSWFLVPVGLPEISIAHSIGIMTMVMIVQRVDLTVKEISFSHLVADRVIKDSLLFLIGYLAAYFL